MSTTRRDFLRKSAAGIAGLAVGIDLTGGLRNVSAAAAGAQPLGAWVRIRPDSSVVVLVNYAEMGQGVHTALPMLVCEELECDFSKVEVQFAPIAPAYNNPAFGIMGTGNSLSVRTMFDPLRRAGAAAREMLVAAAAERWSVPANTIRASNGVLRAPDGRSAMFGELAEAAAVLPVPQEPKLKDRADWKLIGTPVKRLDAPAKVDGSARFGIDVAIPGMVVALIARPPIFGARFAGMDERKAMQVPGVVDVLAVPAGVAVLGTGYWPAKKGRDALEVRWHYDDALKLDSAKERARYGEIAKTPATVARQDGAHPDELIASAPIRVAASYEVPYLAHAPMEPLNCVVDLREGRCEIWTGTQFQTLDRMAAAREAGLAPEQVTLHTQLLGGGFGRRACIGSDFVREAVQVAKAAKKPVKVIWTREDDLRGGWYRPMWHDRLAAGLDADGKPRAWSYRIVGQAIVAGTPFAQRLIKDGVEYSTVEGARTMPYAVPNFRLEAHNTTSAVPMLWWRSVGNTHNGFAIESFVDEMALAARQDPVAYRLALLEKHPRLQRVLRLAAERAGWGTPLEPRRGRGVAVMESYGTFIAQVAEVTVRDGALSVDRFVCAVDCGIVVNPDTVKAQMESSIVYGLSAALFGAITFKDGVVEQSNFHDYPIMRMSQCPRIDTYIVESGERPGGIGEPGTPTVAPALCNAIHAASGLRVRSLPVVGAGLKVGA